MYELRALVNKIKPTTETEARLLKVIELLLRVGSLMKKDEKLWGPAHQAESEARKILEKPNDQG